MKKQIIALITLTLATTTVLAGGSIQSGTSGASCKVEKSQDTIAMEAALLLLQGGEMSEELTQEVENTRAKQAEVIGEFAAQNLTDEELLRVISNQ